MPKLRKINVIFLYVAEMERARKFYEQKIGFNKPVVVSPSWVEYALEEGSTHFALHKSDSEHLKDSAPSRGMVMFSIVVDDLRGAYKELSEKGVTLTRAPETGYDFEFIELEDPDGNLIRLLQFNHV
jgi:catechol 2,3-dioxygenase-like lactoylglutathione lyase family enzyme